MNMQEYRQLRAELFALDKLLEKVTKHLIEQKVVS